MFLGEIHNDLMNFDATTVLHHLLMDIILESFVSLRDTRGVLAKMHRDYVSGADIMSRLRTINVLSSEKTAHKITGIIEAKVTPSTSASGNSHPLAKIFENLGIETEYPHQPFLTADVVEQTSGIIVPMVLVPELSDEFILHRVTKQDLNSKQWVNIFGTRDDWDRRADVCMSLLKQELDNVFSKWKFTVGRFPVDTSHNSLQTGVTDTCDWLGERDSNSAKYEEI